MKKTVVLLAMLLLLSGCSAAPAFETLGNVYASQPIARQEKVSFLLPEDASAVVLAGESGKLYFCEGYEIMQETMAGGDLNRTVQSLTGYDKESLTLLQTGGIGATRYECAWTAAGEAGDQVGRAVILDDGNYHYCLTVMADSTESGSLQETWQAILSSFALETKEG